MPRRTFNPVFWALANIGSRVRFTPAIAQGLTTAALPAEEPLLIPTRHGTLRAVVIRPSTRNSAQEDTLPPVIMQLHGGGFLNRYPEQDRHLARYLAANLGAVIVLPDYSTAPKVQYPVAEEEMHDVARWVQRNGDTNGWDGARLLLSGISAGSKLAINVCQQIHAVGGRRPLAVSLIVPVTDMSRTDRTSSIARPAISPFVQRMVSWAYFPDAARRREPLAAPRHDASLPHSMPPTLIQTGEYDTLAAEGRDLAQVLHAAGVEVLHKEYPQADHDFYTSKPVARVHELLAEITTFFAAHLASRLQEETS
ncbi:alpha/beta hydrolase [Actinoplanes sp. NPDC051494]|uniref:alpha/beta hydrolase n=1 Tax=Actinoplanes sp. NPDC051494 TaxID=3363907 RepID=UPI0037B8E5EC